MNQQPVKVPPYSSDKFVDRETEIELVMEKARDLLSRSPVDRRTVIFIGERGTGKTWLLAHLRTQLEKLDDVILLPLDLADYASRDSVFAVMEILKRCSSEVIHQDELPGATPADMSRALMEDVRDRLEKHPLVVLVDWVYESGWQLLAALEDYLLGPLAIEPRVLIVMAGRGRLYPWKTPELRLKAKFWDLQPFSEVETTVEQLQLQKPEAASRGSEIHSLSHGNPLANFLLAARKDPSEALDEVVSGMLETIPAERRQKVREYLEALSVLRSFDEERIPAMLAAYYGDSSYRDWTYARARAVRQEIVEQAFARWDETRGGYVIDELTRALIERYLKTANPEKWKALHCAAYRLYESWVRDYPRSAARWQQEVDHHAGRLHEEDFSPEDCPSVEGVASIDATMRAAVPA